MNLITLLQPTTALAAGGLIGAGFGILQVSARRRHEALQLKGEFKSGLAAMPGAGKRVAYLLIALVLVQIVCPLLFQNSIRWWVSAGVAVGYGVMLFLQLRERLAQRP